MDCAWVAEEEFSLEAPPLKQEDQQWVIGKIKEATKQQPVATIAPVTRSDTWKPSWVQAACAAVGVVIVIVGFAFWCAYLKSDIGHLQKDVDRIDGRMDSMNGILLNLLADKSPNKALQELGKLQPEQLAKALPTLRAVSEKPLAEVAPSDTLLREIATKLQSAPEASQEYWPTVLQFTHFATSALNPDVPPPGPPWAIVNEGENNTFRGGRFEKKAFLLGGSTIFEDNVFVKCRIVLEANASVRLKNVTFIDCIFDFPPNGDTVPEVRQIARSLLATHLTQAWIPSA